LSGVSFETPASLRSLSESPATTELASCCYSRSYPHLLVLIERLVVARSSSLVVRGEECTAMILRVLQRAVALEVIGDAGCAH
jgi:hypothetical protein